MSSKKLSSITDVRPQSRNVNRHSQRGMGVLEKSIQSDGWIGAITVAADGETFDGSARVETGAAGFADVEPIVVRSDGSRPVIHIREDIATADDPRAIRLGVAANRAAALNYDPDPALLAALAGEVDLSGLYFEHELASLLEREGTAILDANELWKGMPDFEQQDKTAYQSIHVHFRTKEDVEEFARLINQTITDRTRFVWFPFIEIERYADKSYSDEP